MRKLQLLAGLSAPRATEARKGGGFRIVNMRSAMVGRVLGGSRFGRDTPSPLPGGVPQSDGKDVSPTLGRYQSRREPQPLPWPQCEGGIQPLSPAGPLSDEEYKLAQFPSWRTLSQREVTHSHTVTEIRCKRVRWEAGQTVRQTDSCTPLPALHFPKELRGPLLFHPYPFCFLILWTEE